DSCRKTGPIQPLIIRSNRDIQRLTLEIFDRTFTITQVLRLLAILVAVVGILSALLALQLERAREFAVLRAIGMTPGEIGGLVSLQTGFMGAAAGLLALPTGILLAADADFRHQPPGFWLEPAVSGRPAAVAANPGVGDHCGAAGGAVSHLAHGSRSSGGCAALRLKLSQDFRFGFKNRSG
ncbi:MAG: ABC transporter permease, partial [Synechococcaceae cyanobacterium SM1_2_3]|nr:ABC transporter permease [Synechococcaceae cyanobacterium SM1_2_3]